MKELFKDVCKIKQYVLKLDCERLREYKKEFYKKNIAKWQLDLIWEYIWNDREYIEVYFILKKKKII